MDLERFIYTENFYFKIHHPTPIISGSLLFFKFNSEQVIKSYDLKTGDYKKKYKI